LRRYGDLGGRGRPPAARAAHVRLNILGAASLTGLPDIAPFENYTFNGSGALETDIQQGAPADVYAAANRRIPDALYARARVQAGRVCDQPARDDRPPGQSGAHHLGRDITKKGVKIVVCNVTVPCGDYASTAFANLGITAAADKNIVSEETDVTQVVAEIAAGQGDVGFVYITDALAAKGKVTLHHASGEGDAEHAGLDRRGEGDTEPCRGTGVRQARALREGPEDSQGRGLRRG
jgi:ABC-type molybdate transport system substrate-binding protein